MKKLFKGLICAGLCGVLAVGAAGCGSSEHRDAEKDPLRLAIGAVDQKFNPLFYTSLNDGKIAALTQVSMLSADAEGKLAYGEDHPTVTLDYKETYYGEGGSASGQEIGHGDGINKLVGESSVNGTTTYEFLIKNGIKFSDGKPLTVMDVLFNLYTYLDPAYSGSSTMYSTKILGLQAYRQQNPDADENSTESTIKYLPRAQERVEALKEWSEGKTSDYSEADLTKVKSLYLEELKTDWSSIETGWRESYKEYRFNEPWQVFYYIEGVIRNQTERNEVSQAEQNMKDSEGKYLTTIDPDKGVEGAEILHAALKSEAEASYSADKVAAYKAANEGVSDEQAKIALQKDFAINKVYNANAETRAKIKDILTYNATASTALDYFMKDERSKANAKEDLEVPRISGITVSKTKTFNDKTYDEDHDVLKIEIKGVDPKAKWNFSFPVAPMHYYSDEAHTNAAMAAYDSGAVYGGTCKDFGVSFDDINWFNDTLSSEAKNGLPVGAGPYKCCTNKYTSTGVNKDNFFYSNMAFFERNDNFSTMGSGIENAKIKYVTYKVTSDDKIVEALKTKEIDYGEPVATYKNQREVRTGSLKQISFETGGYGYVGLNPKSTNLRDKEVRQAIMHAFDTSSITEYYGDGLVNLINRPMSTTSWAYPEGCTRYYERWTTPQDIIDLVAKSGNWVYNTADKKFHSAADNRVLKLTFTIAGESTDHPSYSMFLDAEKFLEQCGFEISVETNIQALKKLTTGDLEVWAAAWSSSIDPDPYQIYSIDSEAVSTKNWYKQGILESGADGELGDEFKIATELNRKILLARQTLNQTDRENYYSKSTGTSLDKLCCLDLIMELAVEFPTYQRNDLCVYNSAVLDRNSMTKEPSYNMGPIDEMWKLSYVK